MQRLLSMEQIIDQIQKNYEMIVTLQLHSFVVAIDSENSSGFSICKNIQVTRCTTKSSLSCWKTFLILILKFCIPGE